MRELAVRIASLPGRGEGMIKVLCAATGADLSRQFPITTEPELRRSFDERCSVQLPIIRLRDGQPFIEAGEVAKEVVSVRVTSIEGA